MPLGLFFAALGIGSMFIHHAPVAFKIFIGGPLIIVGILLIRADFKA